MIFRYIFVCLTLLITHISYAKELSYKIDGFKEDYSSNVNVSGGILTAFQFGSPSSLAQFDSLFIAKDINTNNLHIRVLSIDGKYSAEFTIEFLSTDSSWVQIKIPTKYKEQVAKYKPEDISIYAYKEEISKRRKKSHMIFPTSWGEPNLLQQKFYLNSAGDFAKFAYYDINNGKTVIFCEPISNKIKTSFNYVCEIPPAAVIKNNTVIFTTTPNSEGKKYKIWKPNP